MTINDLIYAKDFESVYILARYFYRIGEPIMEDGLYDQLERVLKETSPGMQDYFNRTYDDDPVPTHLLSKLGYVDKSKSCNAGTAQAASQSDIFSDASKTELFTSMNEDKSLSIKSVTSYEEAWPFFQFMRENKLDIMTSLKMDGDNTKMLYVDGKYTLAMSRGRDGNSFDFTQTVANVMPLMISTTQKELRVYGESYVDESALPYLREKYGADKYKTCKSAAISMLRILHDKEDYKYLKTKVFMAEGLANTLSEMHTILEQQGVSVVPHKLFKWSDIPEDFDAFKQWLKQNVFDYYESAGKGMPSDGVVVEVNDLLWNDTITNQYSNRQLALKFEQWKFKYTVGVITNILIEQRRVFKSVRVTIDPVVQYDGCTATTINTFDLAVLIDNDLCVGKQILFEKNSGAVNILIHGDKLVKLTSSD